MRARVALVASLLILLPACGSDEPTAPDETTSPVASQTPSPAPTATATPSEDTAIEQAAVWPAASVVFPTPEEAAEDFVVDALGVPASLGDFQAGDSRSGEMVVQFPGEGDGATPVARGLLLLRQLGPDDGWFVLAAPNDVVTIDNLEQGAAVAAGPVTVDGVARGFEGTVVITAFPAGDATGVFDEQVVTAGALQAPEPYEVTLDLSDAEPGSTVTILVQGGTGHELDPGEFTAMAVVISP